MIYYPVLSWHDGKTTIYIVLWHLNSSWNHASQIGGWGMFMYTILFWSESADLVRTSCHHGGKMVSLSLVQFDVWGVHIHSSMDGTADLTVCSLTWRPLLFRNFHWLTHCVWRLLIVSVSTGGAAVSGPGLHSSSSEMLMMMRSSDLKICSRNCCL